MSLALIAGDIGSAFGIPVDEFLPRAVKQQRAPRANRPRDEGGGTQLGAGDEEETDVAPLVGTLRGAVLFNVLDGVGGDGDSEGEADEVE
jgi:hypothetical protein